jgi:hypothetical protein
MDQGNIWAIDSANASWVPSSLAVPQDYMHFFVTCMQLAMRDPIHTSEYGVAYTHACRHTKYKHVCMFRTYTFMPMHELECLECRVVGKCCSNAWSCTEGCTHIQTTECEAIRPRAHVCRHTKYKHACIPWTMQCTSVAYKGPSADCKKSHTYLSST